jgi:hypothetical protein
MIRLSTPPVFYMSINSVPFNRLRIHHQNVNRQHFFTFIIIKHLVPAIILFYDEGITQSQLKG